jgi:NitT/TauT family transport system substrate-binding protein
MNRRALIGAVAGAMLFGTAPLVPANAAEPTPTGAKTHIVVAPLTPSIIPWAAYFIAKPLGYYAAEGLDVDVIKNPPRGSQVSGLLSGQINFGALSSVNNMPSADRRGRMKWFINDQAFQFAIFVLDDSPVKSVRDLAGKTIAMRSPNDEPAVKIAMAGGDVKPGQYKTMVSGPGMPGGVALQRGAAQALMGTAVDQFEIQAGGIHLRQIDLESAAGLYNGGLMATTEELSKNRDVAARFARALAKAYIWTFENPDATLDLLAGIVPEAVQNRDSAKRILLSTNDGNRPLYERHFRADPAIYQRQIDLEAEVGVLPKSFPAAEVFTNDFVDEMWNFDIEAVKAQARSGKH